MASIGSEQAPRSHWLTSRRTELNGAIARGRALFAIYLILRSSRLGLLAQAKAAGVSGGAQSSDSGASQHSSEQHAGSEQEAAPAAHSASDEHSGGTE